MIETSYTKSKREPKTNVSMLQWGLLLFLAILFFVAPFYKGLFNGGNYSFEQPIVAFTLLGALFLIASLVLVLKKSDFDVKELLIVVVWFIPLIYYIASFQAASHHLAVLAILINFFAAAIFIISRFVSDTIKGNDFLKLVIVLSGYMLLMYGFLNWFGQAHYQDAILAGSRLSNVFQYPNTYAAYLIGLLISCTVYIYTSKNKYSMLINAIMLVPIWTSLLLSFSRGALVVMPIVLIIWYCLIPLRYQIKTSINLVISGVVALLIMQPLVNIRLSINSNEIASSVIGWLILISASIITGFIIWILNKYLDKWNLNVNWKIANYVLPFAILIISVFSIFIIKSSLLIQILPESLAQRMQTMNLDESSISSRVDFNKDAFKVYKDFPFIGSGGGAWSSLYEEYKSYYYTSRQAHNFFMQSLVEIGTIGTLVLLLFFLTIIFLFIKKIFVNKEATVSSSDIIYLIFVLVILFHSVIDFDISFVFIYAFLFVCLGAMVGRITISQLGVPILNRKFWKYSLTGVLAIVSLIVIINCTNLLKSYSKFDEFTNLINSSTTDFNTINAKLDQALQFDSKNPQFILYKISLLKEGYTQTKNETFYNESVKWIEKLKKLEPYNKDVIDQEITLYIQKNNKTEAANLINEKITKYKWQLAWYEKYIVLNFDLWNEALGNGDANKAELYFQEAKMMFKKLTDQKNGLAKLSKNQQYESRGFTITPTIALTMGQFYYLTDNYSTATEILRNNLVWDNVKDPTNNKVGQWYLASLYKQKLDDPAYLQVLKENDSNVQLKIDEILKLK